MRNEPLTRVAAYCRVSTDSADQANSLVSQRRFFREYISRHPEWELVEIYADEGLSGTGTKKRASFNRMIADAKAGCFDLILTKEISRFARNTLDSLYFTRELHACGVSVMFMNDGIHTADPDAELRLSIFSSLAQEESRKTSDRVRWGQRRSMEAGVVFGRDLLGYDVRGGRLTVNEAGAETVRLIFHKYLDENKGCHVIARELRDAGVKTARYMRLWSPSVILRVLKNEKYCGDLVQQKTYTPDYLTHEKKYNHGERELVVIRDHHEPIIPRERFEAAQTELARRSALRSASNGFSNRCALSGKLRCAACGASYIRVQRGSVRWACVNQRRNGKRHLDPQGEMTGCDNPTLSDADVRLLLRAAVADVQFPTEKLFRVIKTVFDSEKEKSGIERLRAELTKNREKQDKLIGLHLAGEIDADAFRLHRGRLYREEGDLSEQLRREQSRRQPERREQALAAIRETLRQIAAGECWDEVFYRRIVQGVSVSSGAAVSAALRHVPGTWNAKILRGNREINGFEA